MAGVNRAYLIKVLKDPGQAGERKTQRPCIFLAHLAVDREAASAIGEYMAIRGEMDIYLDLYDEAPAGIGDGDQMEQYLAEGLAQASHVMVLVSPETPEPFWIRRLFALSKASGAEFALLTLKGTPDAGVSYCSDEILRGIKSLNEYLFRVSPEVDRIIFNNPEYGGLMAHTAPNHPLDAFLDWEK
jgi:hypothetical protein